MKRFVKVLPVLLAVSILTVSLSCSSKDEKILKGLETTESGAGTGEISRKRIAELKKGIEEYKRSGPDNQGRGRNRNLLQAGRP